MELEVYWLQFAEDKLDDIYNYYRVKAGKRIAQRIVIGILETTLDLNKQPELGQIETNLRGRKEQFRYLVFKNYKIVYFINYTLGRIEIANILIPDKIREK